MRVLMIAACPFPWPRGTPVRVHRLAEAITQRGHTVDVLTYHLGDTSIELPFQVYRTPAITAYTKVSPGPSLTKLAIIDPLLTYLIWKTAQRKQYDLVHAHHIESLIASRVARFLGVRLPIIYDAHTQLGEELTHYGPRLGSRIKRSVGHWLDTWLPRGADQIITVTEELRELFIQAQSTSADRIIVVTNGIELEFLDKVVAARNRMTGSPNINSSAAFGGNPSAPLLVFAGNLASYQRIDLLLKAFAEVRKSMPRVGLKLLTDDDFSPFTAQAHTLGIATAIDVQPTPLDELPEELVSAAVLVNPRTECRGIPQKLLNYMASGTPVVSFRGSAKILEHRRTGLIIENGDIAGLASAIIELLNNAKLGEQLGQKAQALIRERYSWEAAARDTESVYLQTLRNVRPRSLHE